MRTCTRAVRLHPDAISGIFSPDIRKLEPIDKVRDGQDADTLMWVLLALLCAGLLGLYQIAKKSAVTKNAVAPVVFLSTLSATLPAAVQLFFPLLAGEQGFGQIALTREAHLLVLIKSVIVSTSWLLSFTALKQLPISLAAPIRESGPLWTVAGALLIFGERLTPAQWIGAATVMVSYFAFSAAGRSEGIRFFSDRWVGAMALATLLASASSLYDKHLIQNLGYPVPALQFWFYLYNSVILFGVAALRSGQRGGFRWHYTIVAAGLLLFVADLAYFHAVAQDGAMIAVISLIRRGSVVVPFIAGLTLFQEKVSKSKVLALLAMMAGIALLSVMR